MASTTFTSGTPVTKEWLNDVNNAVYSGAINAKNYGVVGNGVANDTVALQAALYAAAGKSLYLPAGTYKITASLLVSSNTKIVGEGRNTIITTGTTITGTSGNNLLDISNTTGIEIYNVSLNGSNLVSLPGGHRVIHAFNASKYIIQNCYFATSGAAIGSLQCSDYQILNNTITISGNAGIASHDGIIDQWYGSHDFIIRGNVIYGNGQGKYAILVTGTDTAANPTLVYNFTITENRVYNVTVCGIWVMGRTGIAKNFVVSNNIVDTVTQFYGLGASDCMYGTITGNVVRNTAYAGIRAFSEGSGVTGVQYTVIANNVFENTNTLSNPSLDPGSAIVVTENSTHVQVANNSVKGTLQKAAVYIGLNSSYVFVTGNDYAMGTNGRVVMGATAKETCTIPEGITYTTTYTNRANVSSATGVVATRFWREGDYVLVEGIVDIVPTAAAADTQLAISLPIASNFTVGNEAAGQAVSTDGQSAACGNVDIVNDDVRIRFTSASTASKRWMYRFRYKVQ